ncbi:MAG TPA: histidinol-phosphate transaminase [Candidatus Acidoferrum sp.]|nr:histidinol-phosphate transaminase [Candidatus Acidoferrum sp.]
MNYERPNIQAMRGYTSGEQPDQADVIKLNTNENPYPPGPAVAKALAALQVESLRRYPPPTALGLRKQLATLHAVDAANIIVTNGGDELLRLLLATFVAPDESIATASPSYSLYEVLAAAHGCGMKEYPLDADWSLPTELAAKLNADKVKLCFIVNPHAPSGTLCPVAQLEALARDFRGVLVIDEAYVNFVDPGLQYDAIPLIRQFDNVLLLRTFSKGYSLAGLRMAYGLGPSSLIDPMQYKTKDSYNTDLIAQTLALAAVSDQAYAADTWRRVRDERSKLRDALAKLGLPAPPSQSNFLLATVPAPLRAEQLYEGLKTAGILVRYFKLPGLDDKLRITVGTPEENTRLLHELQRLTQR